MKSNKLFLLMAMLVLAVFAVGSVSAAENVTTDIDVQTDDIALDDVSVEEAVDQEEITEEVTTNSPTIYNVDHTSNFTYYMSTANSSNKVILNFTDDTYDDFSLTLNSYVELWGNGVTLNGAASQDIFTVTNTNNIVIKDFIINVGSNAAAIYGHHVTHSVFTNNTITGGKDGINIFQIHKNLTITDNTISGFTRDGISLVNFDTLNDTAWNDFVASNVSGNTITGGEFAGKRVATNGKLGVLFNNNTIVNVLTGINMYHPNVICFNLTNSDIEVDSEEGEYAILTNANFNATGYIGVYNSTFVGLISSAFKTAAGNNTGNNSGF